MSEHTATPPGWPEEVPPPAAPEFRERAVLWLLDQAPPEFRSHLVFRRHPAALAFAVSCYVDGALEASRRAYSGARRTLAGELDPAGVDEVLRALEFEGVRLRILQRELELVTEALAGRRWAKKL